jgi:hypothetical protein
MLDHAVDGAVDSVFDASLEKVTVRLNTETS